MDGANPDPFQGGTVGSGLVFIPPIIMGIPSTEMIETGPHGPFFTAHTAAVLLPTSGGPTPSTIIPTIPPFIPGGSGPSTSILAIPTIPVSTPIIGS